MAEVIREEVTTDAAQSRDIADRQTRILERIPTLRTFAVHVVITPS
jgi:hypothetical protein